MAICKCSSHIISFDLSKFTNTNANYLLDFDSKIEIVPLPADGIDYVIHFNNPKDRFFERIGNWFRIWTDKKEESKWQWGPNPGIKLPNELSDGNISVFDTFIHSRSNCGLIYDYFPPIATGNGTGSSICADSVQTVQMPTINLLF